VYLASDEGQNTDYVTIDSKDNYCDG